MKTANIPNIPLRSIHSESFLMKISKILGFFLFLEKKIMQSVASLPTWERRNPGVRC